MNDLSLSARLTSGIPDKNDAGAGILVGAQAPDLLFLKGIGPSAVLSE
ncbi:hypothetical protein ABZ446_21240 [Streptomyces sp. NPDC005813]